MSNYNFSNNQIGAAGDGAVAYKAVFNNETVKEDDLDLDSLKKEILELKRILDLKQEKSADDYKILGHIVEIGSCLDRKDLNNLMDKITKSASKLFYSMSLGVGTGILANLISKSLGI